MKFTILAPALLAASTAIAAPAALNPLSARGPSQCWAQDPVDTTSPTSPLASDCQALSEDETFFDSLPGGVWVPTEDNNYTFDVANGTCGIKGVFDPNGGSLGPSDMALTADLVGSVLGWGVEVLAKDGRVSLNGSFACMVAGWITHTGWVRFDVYNTGSV